MRKVSPIYIWLIQNSQEFTINLYGGRSPTFTFSQNKKIRVDAFSSDNFTLLETFELNDEIVKSTNTDINDTPFLQFTLPSLDETPSSATPEMSLPLWSSNALGSEFGHTQNVDPKCQQTPSSDHYQMQLLASQQDGSTSRVRDRTSNTSSALAHESSSDTQRFRDRTPAKYRERNRLAAARSRQKQADLIQLLEEEKRDEDRRRRVIEADLSSLKTEVTKLREEIRLHIRLSKYLAVTSFSQEL
ncbi:Ochratoxin biosynthesis cluster transcription factor ota4 [Metarhizium brunneum]|uniref:Ochratoxin biosynthesis cluster transcription factor ota4 n=1 Tax=Metarhizium brunneum TaxID=500148 RepID=A0A7D5YV42_9HYPO|nr:Ochratoxin biosynthesis cluster transcription factor ota4 [Metarhizium brunneum]